MRGTPAKILTRAMLIAAAAAAVLAALGSFSATTAASELRSPARLLSDLRAAGI